MPAACRRCLHTAFRCPSVARPEGGGPARHALPVGAARAHVGLPRVVQRALAAVVAPLKLGAADDHAVALAHAARQQRRVHARHLQHARKAPHRVPVVPVGHLRELLQALAVDVEHARGAAQRRRLARHLLHRHRVVVDARVLARGQPRRVHRVRLAHHLGRAQRVQQRAHATHQLLHAAPRGGRDGVAVRGVRAARHQPLTHVLPELGRLGHVHLVVRHHLRLALERGAEQLQLQVDGVVVAQRVGRRAVNHVHQRAAARHVAQELVAQAQPLVRALQQARHVGKHGGTVVALAHAQVGHERGEGVGRDLGARRAQHAEQRGLARVGHADDAAVGHHLELQVQPRLQPLLAALRKRGRVVARRLEAGVAAPPAPAHHQQRLLALLQQLRQRRLVLAGILAPDDGATWDRDVQVGRVSAVAVPTLAIHSACCAPMHLCPEGKQGIELRVCHCPNIASSPTVATCWASMLHEFLASECHTAIATITTANVNACCVKTAHFSGQSLWPSDLTIIQAKLALLAAFIVIRVSLLGGRREYVSRRPLLLLFTLLGDVQQALGPVRTLLSTRRGLGC
mmetsp:Transcript_35998/g.90927  ORF Transcript_35998/g.90927 Transcript_35998/m.90927 type:complete len:571 (+) Transcript_35998:229-1941(+)